MVDGASSVSEYNYAGNRIKFKDEAGRQTNYDYDEESRLSSVGAPNQALVEYTYDKAGNLLWLQVNADENRMTEYEYDVLNRRVLERFPEGQGGRTERAYAYDKAHNVKKYTDGRGVEVDLSDRDGVGRILTKTYTVPAGNPDIPGVPVVHYGYDDNGNLAGISNANGSASWTYDALDRLSEETVASGPKITYTYDPRGVIKHEAVEGRPYLNVDHEYDAVGRREWSERNGQRTEFHWDGASRRWLVKLPNGVETKYAYHDAGWVSNIEYKKDTTVFENYAYIHDDVGNPTQVATNNHGTYTYEYDDAYRLTSDVLDGFDSEDPEYDHDYIASYTYDAMGNRLTRTLGGATRTYTYNDADQVTGWAENTTSKVGSYIYDADGNMTRKLVKEGDPLVNTDQWDYQYDAVGRMDNGQQSVVADPKSTRNVYVGDQWYRVRSATGTATSPATMKYGWRRDELFAEFDGNGDLTASYLNDGVDRPFYKTRFSGDGSTVVARDFYHQDANLRIHHLTNGSGNVSEKYVYNGYGRRTILDASNNPLDASAYGNRIGFQGREHEDLKGDAQEAGLTFHRNRLYDPDLGRWGSRDPAGYEDGFSS